MSRSKKRRYPIKKMAPSFQPIERKKYMKGDQMEDQ
jgi:hypothetical protein